MALQHHLTVTSPDLDPAMIARASAHRVRGDRRVFLVGAVPALPSPTGTFDLVVSTLSLHHGADPTAGLAEIGCVLHPGGQALVWNVRPGGVPCHADAPDPVAHVQGTALRVVAAAPEEPASAPRRLFHADD